MVSSTLKQRAQGVAASGPYCFICQSHAGVHPSPEMLQHPFASWVPLDGPAAARRDAPPRALRCKLGAVGHSTTALSDAQLLHPGSRTLLFSEDKKWHYEGLLRKREAFSLSWLWQRAVFVPPLNCPDIFSFPGCPPCGCTPLCRGTKRTVAGPHAG